MVLICDLYKLGEYTWSCGLTAFPAPQPLDSGSRWLRWVLFLILKHGDVILPTERTIGEFKTFLCQIFV
jgi:hypothetical protein